MTEDISKVVWPGWETVRLIGNGSFGAVYEIQRSVFGEIETAALKVISIPQNAGDIEEMYSDGYDDESLTNTFHDHLKSIVAEYSMMKKMSDCVNVVKCEDVRYIQHDDKIGWDIFIKMELLTPLVRALPDKIPEKTVIHLAKDICNALITCSKHNIVHRDIKPQNIFISARGDYKLGDFGIAKTVEKTMGGTKIGTYRYMSPEVYNNQPYGSGADIYSLGLVLYWLLNERRLPFLPLPPVKLKAGMDEEARQRRLSGKEPLPLPAHGSEALKNIVMKACAYDPANRYRSAGEMLEDIERCIEESDNSSSGNHSSTEDDLTASVLQARCLDTSTQASNKENININLPEISAIEQVDGTVSVFEDPKQNSESIDPPKNRKSHKTIYAIAGILCIILALGIIFGSKILGGSNEAPIALESQALPAETESATEDKQTTQWSEWVDTLPSNVSSENYEIEETTLFRSREKETTTSSEATMDGWEQYDTSVSTGEYGAWSNWSTTPVSATNTRKVEEATQYRYRDLQTTTSTSNTLSGWTLSDQTSAWGDYGSWSSWKTTPVSGSDSRQVETKTQYSYRTKTVSQEYTDWGSWSSWQDNAISEDQNTDVETRTVYLYYWYQCPNCGAHMHGYGFVCPTWAGGCGQAMISDQYQVIWGTIPQSEMGFQDWHGTGHTYAYYQGNLVFRNIYNPNESKTQYRYRTRSLKDVVSYSNWSSYGDTPVSNASTKEVRTRTVYRYRDRSLQYTYYFSKWGDWSSWSTTPVSTTSNRQVETQQVYRYADKGQSMVYHFWRWGEWTDFSEKAVTKNENVDVEEKTVFRYRKL